MNYIEELYAGHLTPSDQQFQTDSKYGKLMQQSSNAFDELLKLLNDNGKEVLERISYIQADINDITAFDNYAMGFRDGARLMIDILLGSNENLISK